MCSLSRRLFLFMFLLLVVTGGCMDLRPELDDPTPRDLPDTFSLYSSAAADTAPWWQELHSPELTRLITRALEANTDLHQAWARVKQNRALAVQAGATQLPDLTVDSRAAHLRSDTVDGNQKTRDDFSLGLSTGYELDLWGRVQAGARGAQDSLQASREDLLAMQLSVSGQVGEAWVERISQQLQEKQLHRELELNTRLQELIEMRFTLSRATALDVYQQRQTVTAIQGGLIKTKSLARLQENRLALLTGRPAPGNMEPGTEDFPQITELPATGLPADLLANRPDIRAAGLRLQSARWQVAAARADRLPRIMLGGSINYTSSSLSLLLDNWIAQLAASLTGPIFDGGFRRAEVERTMAVMEERLAAYRGVVLAAILEVENSLTREQQYRKSLANIETQLQITSRAYREATWRYLYGMSDFLPVLREQINLITFQLDRIKTRAELIKARISLYKALGGGLPAQVPNPQPAEQS